MIAPVPPAKRGKMIALIGLGLVSALLIFRPASEPEWGEPDYEPKIGNECRAVWASADVDAPAYLATICNADERHEIAGYRPRD